MPSFIVESSHKLFLLFPLSYFFSVEREDMLIPPERLNIVFLSFIFRNNMKFFYCQDPLNLWSLFNRLLVYIHNIHINQGFYSRVIIQI